MKKILLALLILVVVSPAQAKFRVGKFYEADLYEAVLLQDGLNCLYISGEGYALWEVFSDSCPATFKIFVENKNSNG